MSDNSTHDHQFEPEAAVPNVVAHDVTDTEVTPSLPPRPTQESESMTATNANGQSTPGAAPIPDEQGPPEIAALRAMFPDFDATVLQSVLESVNGDQDRAIDILLGMNDPTYVSTHHASEPTAQTSLELDEQLARQLMLEDQEQQQRHRASGQSWPRRDQPQSQSPPPQRPTGNTDLQEFQQTVGRIAESGKRTFSSIVSKVKAKISEYDQQRQNQSSTNNLTPQWGEAPPTGVDRHTAQQTYSQGYYGNDRQAPSQAPQVPPPKSVETQDIYVEGYDVNSSSSTGQPIPGAAPTSAQKDASEPTAASPAVYVPSPLPSPSKEIPSPPRTLAGSPINAAKLGLLPKRPVSLLTSQPTPTPARHPDDDDDDLEYAENPFEEAK